MGKAAGLCASRLPKSSGFVALQQRWTLDLQLAAELDDAIGGQLEELHRAF
jgi:hypothetical protein